MIRTFILPLMLACLMVVVGLGHAQDDPDMKKENPDAPPRLKKKKRPATPDVKESVKDKDKAKDEEKDKDKDKKDKKGKDEDEPIVPEDGMMGEPQEDEAEILERVNRNMRAVEEKLGNREVGDPTQQQQRDILKDLDSLIRKSQQQEQGGGGGGADQQPQGGQDEKQGEDKQGGAQKQKGGQGQKMAGGKKGQRQPRAQRQPRQGNRMMAGGKQPKQGEGQGKGQGKGQQPGKQPGQGGNQPGKGGDGPRNDKELDNKVYKDVWGHLPESLRAEMNAYSNGPFMPRYDDLIKKYYRTIAEKGRSKGD